MSSIEKSKVPIIQYLVFPPPFLRIRTMACLIEILKKGGGFSNFWDFGTFDFLMEDIWCLAK